MEFQRWRIVVFTIKKCFILWCALTYKLVNHFTINLCYKTESVIMRTASCSLIVFFILLVESVNSLNRSSFPVNFLFGVASSSYQVLVLSNKAHFIVQYFFVLSYLILWCDKYEGAASEGGRGPSIWDTFTHKYPCKWHHLWSFLCFCYFFFNFEFPKVGN